MIKPHYQRTVVPNAERRKLLSSVRLKMLNPFFFKQLTPATPYHSFHRVRIFEFGSHKLAIKDTEYSKRHGMNWKAIRKDVTNFMVAIRQKQILPKKYILKLPKAYGRVGKFLVMEYVKDLTEELIAQDKRMIDLIDNAKKELKTHLTKFSLSENTKTWLVAQVDQAMVAGIKNGKVILYLPYDTQL